MLISKTGLQTRGRATLTRQNYTSAVATEIRVQAARLQVTHAQLAAALGLSESNVSRRMGGHTPFTIEEVAAVASLLGVEVADLLPKAYDGDPVNEVRQRRDLPPLEAVEQAAATAWAPRGSNPQPADWEDVPSDLLRQWDARADYELVA